MVVKRGGVLARCAIPVVCAIQWWIALILIIIVVILIVFPWFKLLG